MCISSLLFFLAASSVWAQVPTGQSGLLDIPEAAPLRPPKPYDPSLTPRVGFLVVASLPGEIPCSALSSGDLENLERSYCRNLGMIANLSSAWFAETCEASCPPSRRRLLQVNPIVFEIDCVRATEDPQDVPQANMEAMALEQEALYNDLLENSLEATLPGARFVAENISSTFVSGAISSPGASEATQAGTQLAPTGSPATGGAMAEQIPSQRPVQASEPSANYQVEYPSNPKGAYESCYVDGAWHQHGLFVYCKDCVYNYCRCCNGVWTQCTNVLTGNESPSC